MSRPALRGCRFHCRWREATPAPRSYSLRALTVGEVRGAVKQSRTPQEALARIRVRVRVRGHEALTAPATDSSSGHGLCHEALAVAGTLTLLRHLSPSRRRHCRGSRQSPTRMAAGRRGRAGERTLRKRSRGRRTRHTARPPPRSSRTRCRRHSCNSLRGSRSRAEVVAAASEVWRRADIRRSRCRRAHCHTGFASGTILP